MPNHTTSHLDDWNTELRQGISRSIAFFRRTLKPGTRVTDIQAQGLADLFALIEDVLAEVHTVHDPVVPDQTLHKIVAKTQYKNL